MRAWRATQLGTDLEGIMLREVPEPRPPTGSQLVVEVAAAGIALPDILLLAGAYPGVARTLPRPIGIEYAGTVRERGPQTRRIAVGDRVCGMVYPPQGAASELVTVDESGVAVLPSQLTMNEGAATPSAFMTAHDALRRHGSVRRGERVLVLAAASGIGLALVQLATQIGAEVYGAASSGKLERVRAAGAVETFDYTVTGWDHRLEGLDVVLDPIGGDSFRRSFDMLGFGGRLICLDVISRYPDRGAATDYRREPTDPKLDPVKLIARGKSVVGINMPSLWERYGGQWVLLSEALTHLESGAIRPAISEVFGFTDAVAALRCVQERRSIGRVVLDVRGAAQL